ncbi:N-acetylglucosaminyl-phosphatidylinositol-deacetylase [Trypanosoma grayi]|uniref:N-acetylglucosaminyl-phosphatidylinositol- deacetylase n=1 Tax=Trypanosoma grayi TaxID=71804 RepID=UPI0004F437CB|nr:N-acetylglucosaminyl-phosphatidylinositol-deacetylase [Trypanosoma grayi]KEG10712.1 N-acetylglucosaminyl-phosphatidylinositol-deacetylase [Trypanosoma grayi]
MPSLFVVCVVAVVAGALLQWQRKAAAISPRVLGDVLLVFAHPDDEAMFFSPLLEYLRQHDLKVHFLCLSNGNYAGLGAAREKELYRSGQYFGVHKNNVKVVNHPSLQDGLNRSWDSDLIRQEVFSYLKKAKSVRTVVTFDRWGVSYHPNHIAVHSGVRSAKENMPPGIVFLNLRTRGLLRKYSGVLSVVSYIFRGCLQEDHHRFVILMPPISILTSFFAMRMHKTQLVWFRYLFVLFSSYTYINEMEELKTV